MLIFLPENSKSFQSVVLHNCFVEALDFSLISASGHNRSSVPLLTFVKTLTKHGQTSAVVTLFCRISLFFQSDRLL